MKLRVEWLVVALALLTGAASAQTFKREELRVPAPGSGPRGLQVLLVKPDLPGRLPLVVISHGSPLKPEDRRMSRPHLYLPHAIEFARRGWAAAIVMRRGFGDSGGEYGESPGPCTHPDHVRSSTRASADVRAGIAFLQRRPDIDSTRLLAVGQSTGGVVTIALTTDPPPGLLAAINFAGGVIPTHSGKPCKDTGDRLVEAFRVFGKRSRVPMLWIYGQNDQLFPPKLVQQLMSVFSAGGGKAELIQAPPFRNDGHSLFAFGIRQWTPYVDQFLKQQELVILAEPLPRPAPPIALPPQFPPDARESFEGFALSAPHRALAMSKTKNVFSWRGAMRSVEAAKKDALAACQKNAPDCQIVVVDDEAVP